MISKEIDQLYMATALGLLAGGTMGMGEKVYCGLPSFPLATALGLLAGGAMGMGEKVYCGLPSFPHEKTKLNSRQKKRRKNVKLAKKSKKRNRKK